MSKKTDKPQIDEQTKREIGLRAGDAARTAILEACNNAGLTIEKTAKAVADALEANAVKVQLTIDGQWTESSPYTDHVTRLKAVEAATVLLDLKPVERKKMDLTSNLTDEEIDRQLELLSKKASGK